MRRVSCGLLAAVIMAVSAPGEEAPESPLKSPDDLIAVQDPPKVVPRLLDRATPENTSIVVSLGRQRAYLFVEKEAAIDTPVSTGKRRGQTPAGQFAIAEKLSSHSSSLHGDFVDADGSTVRHGVSTRIDAAPSGTKFRVVPVQYFMQLDGGGVALHAGRLPGYPAADTAVRLPPDIAPLIFQRVKKGTPVKIEE